MTQAERDHGQPGKDCVHSLLSGQFQEDLQNFMYARLDRVDPRRESGKYAEVDDLAERLQEVIESVLGEEDRNKMFELIDLQSVRDEMLTEMYYRRGFEDGVRVILGVMMGVG